MVAFPEFTYYLVKALTKEQSSSLLSASDKHDLNCHDFACCLVPLAESLTFLVFEILQLKTYLELYEISRNLCW